MPKLTIKNNITPRKNVKPVKVTSKRNVNISDDEIIDKILKQYRSAWKKLAKL